MAGTGVYILITKGKRFSFVHHSVVYVQGGTGGDYVYGCTIDAKNDQGGCVVKTDYNTFIQDHEPIYFFKTALTEADVLSKVQELDNKHYLSIFYNCSDFTRQVSDLSPFWSQKNMLVAGLFVVGALIFANYKSGFLFKLVK